jgi:hypothetical protein
MRVFNLTDVPTKALAQHKLLNQTIVVGGKAIPPGGSVDLEGKRGEVASAHHPLKVGAAAIDDLPRYYQEGKARPKASPTPPSAPPAVRVSDDGAVPVSKRSKAV